ncbi:hypothetical protein R3W88_017773 [Solanum pinnatisectum]|uniref:Uncharacterized protein n=1 Tax=Solanum pinnatisectum TaxID=50273 RepID=A0AAV9L4C1_9SOLN|nr:hypothetical protein R3W88_017773 [Solanum pinnatisectum]
MAATTTKLSIKLLIDSKAKKVVFAEVEKNFVDFLVENLNNSYMKKSKDMIIKPECPVGISSVCSYVIEGVYKICPFCNNSMSMVVPAVVQPVGAATDGGIVKETVKYMVMDDLIVKPLSVSNIMGHVKNVVALHEQVVQFRIEEALKLLKLSLESNTVLTSLFASRVKVEN